MTEAILVFVSFWNNAPPPDVYHLARAIEGERPDLVCPGIYDTQCQELADRVGQAVLNRLNAGWCESVQACVDGGFWGAEVVMVPQRWAVESALRVLLSPVETDDFYVFSVHDREKLGLQKGDANFVLESGEWGLYFYGPNTTW